MKPIEPGCTAIIIGKVRKNLGKVVKVHEFVGKLPEGVIPGIRVMAHDWWKVDRPLLIAGGNSENIMAKIPYAREKYMQRLDDEEDTFEAEKRSKKEVPEVV
jgi:hypothetical protein